MYVTKRHKRKSTYVSLAPIYIGNEKFDEVAAHKILEAILDDNLSWTDHVNELTKRISKKLHQLSKTKHFLNAHARKEFIHAHVQFTIDYASTLWDSASASALKPLSGIHRRALKLIFQISTTLTAHDYKCIDILRLKSKLEYIKRYIYWEPGYIACW